MNVNPESEQFCNVVPWDSLTDEQKASGEWIELPTIFPGEQRRAGQKRESEIEKLYSAVREQNEIEKRVAAFTATRGSFDANGKPRR